MTYSPHASARRHVAPTRDAFYFARQLVDSAVPAVADIAAVEVSDALFDEHTALSEAGAGDRFRRAAFRAVCGHGSRCAYRIGEVSRIPCGTPYRRTLADRRPRVIACLPPQTRWLARDPVRAPLMHEDRVHSLMVVPLVAHRVVLGLVAFYRCNGSSPFGQADLRTAARLAARFARMLDDFRRDLREQAMGRILQHALLARPPRLTAIEDVHGHVPASGAPGGWFDVIPLPGTRVGLAVGFSGGRGIAAAAAMSRQKARVATLAALDVDPVETLTHSLRSSAPEPLRSPAEEYAADPGQADNRCLYAVYDPVTGHCAAARTGAAVLTVVAPDGDVTSMGPSASDPAEGDSCDVAVFDVPPGSLLVLSCASTPERRRCAPQDRAGADGGSKGTDVRLPITGRNSHVLLTARTRTVAPTDIATWDLPNDPTAVADARDRTATQLTAWGLPDLSFSTTLVVSELVTNAIRYSSGSIRLRLIRDDTLICEVSDNSSAAPRTHTPAPSDQGGRGLIIVAHLARAHGTRYTAPGKIVWAEQAIDQG
ncbi:ATP-binding protein [Streptomyces chiangmaiensis]|uniref:ATP-binding protein n=1 Tax=Streptomyces chiangmaiensis TaxID=766497 RepID=A0ABU7FMV3_9ACTN|nr:ATP-binding protein [Streptomyces chiangmaiensis]MED7825455.1 ATP-binding protein [Streptomyces chiangmaiensis]